MEIQYRPYKNAALWLMVGGFIFIITVPMNIENYQNFEGLFEKADVFKAMVRKGILTGSELRSFEITLYVYVSVCVVLAITHVLLNKQAILMNASIRGDDMAIFSRKAIKGLTFILGAGLFGLIVPMHLLPEASASQGLKGWFLIRVGLTGAAFIFGCIVMVVYFAVSGGAEKRTGDGVEK